MDSRVVLFLVLFLVLLLVLLFLVLSVLLGLALLLLFFLLFLLIVLSVSRVVCLLAPYRSQFRISLHQTLRTGRHIQFWKSFVSDSGSITSLTESALGSNLQIVISLLMSMHELQHEYYKCSVQYCIKDNFSSSSVLEVTDFCISSSHAIAHTLPAYTLSR